MGKPVRIAIVALAVLLAASFAKDMAIKISVERFAAMATGLRVSMSGFSVGILRPVVHIKGLKVLSPRGYPEKIMFIMPEIYLNYDLPAIMKKDMHLREMRLDLKVFNVVKNRSGELNLDSLKVVRAEKKKEGPKAAEKSPPAKIRIDRLRLKIGKVFYKDYFSGSEPSITEYDIDIDETYEDIDNAYELVSLLVVRALANTSVSRLTGFDPSALKSTVSGTLASAKKVASEIGQKTIGETAKQAQGAVRDAAEALKKQIGLPFGSE
jgi:hypothetical protein